LPQHDLPYPSFHVVQHAFGVRENGTITPAHNHEVPQHGEITYEEEEEKQATTEGSETRQNG